MSPELMEAMKTHILQMAGECKTDVGVSDGKYFKFKIKTPIFNLNFMCLSYIYINVNCLQNFSILIVLYKKNT